MDRLIERLMELKDSCLAHNAEICRVYSIATDMMPVAGLNMAYNQIVRAVELASYYNSVLPRPRRGSLEDYCVDEPESAARVGDLLNSCFVAVMSVFESCARKAVRLTPKSYGKVPSKIYLVNIIERSRKLGWLELSDEIMWKRCVKLRNYIVHNNGEALESGCFSLESGLIWEFRAGLQSKVTFRHIPETLSWVITAYARWCWELLKGWSAAFDYSPVWNAYYTFNISASRIIPHWGCDVWAGHGQWTWLEQPPAPPRV